MERYQHGTPSLYRRGRQEMQQSPKLFYVGALPTVYANFNSRVAQLVEHAAVNRRVVGSYPTSGAIFWEYRIAAIAGDCKFPGRKAFVGASPTAPTIFRCQQTHDAEERHIGCKLCDRGE